VLVCVARSKQVYIEWMEATVLLTTIYLSSELILIDTKVLSARCPLAEVPGSACETPPPRHYLADVYRLLPITETRPIHNGVKG
jgi:hypothetical protein